MDFCNFLNAWGKGLIFVIYLIEFRTTMGAVTGGFSSAR